MKCQEKTASPLLKFSEGHPTIQFYYLLDLVKNDISKTENPMRSTISAEERL